MRVSPEVADPSGAKHKGRGRAWAVERDGEPVKWMVAYVFEATDERCGREVGGPNVAKFFHFICRKPKGHKGPHAWRGYN